MICKPEIWVQAPEPFNQYQVSDCGNVRKRINEMKAYRKKPFHYHKKIDNGETMRVQLGPQKATISRLVYAAFVDDLSDGMVIAHLDGDYTNNVPSNLAQVTQLENISHKRDHGTWQAGPTHPKARSEHSYELADQVRAQLQSAKITKSGRLARGEADRIAHELNVSIHFVRDIRYKGAWERWYI